MTTLLELGLLLGGTSTERSEDILEVGLPTSKGEGGIFGEASVEG